MGSDAAANNESFFREQMEQSSSSFYTHNDSMMSNMTMIQDQKHQAIKSFLEIRKVPIITNLELFYPKEK